MAMSCKECNYNWKDDDADYPSCHWKSRAPGDIPPCEEEEENLQDDAW